MDEAELKELHDKHLADLQEGRMDTFTSHEKHSLPSVAIGRCTCPACPHGTVEECEIADCFCCINPNR